MNWINKQYKGRRIIFDKRYYKLTKHKGATILWWYFDVNDLNNQIHGYKKTYFTLRSLKNALVVLNYIDVIVGLIILIRMHVVSVKLTMSGPNEAEYNSKISREWF